MGDLLLLASILLLLLIYISVEFTLPWRQMQRDLGYAFRRRGSNPPGPGRKPAPPMGPPEQPLTAKLMRYRRWEDNWKDEQVYGSVPAEIDAQPHGPRLVGDSIKPTPTKPQPHGGRQIPNLP